MLKNGFIQGKNKYFSDLLVLAKYLFYLGKDHEQVEKEILLFCNKHIAYFNSEMYYKAIDKMLKMAKESGIRHNTEICITQAELDKIQTVTNLNQQKILFVMLVTYKVKNCKSFKISRRELFKLSSVSGKYEATLNMLQQLTQLKLIGINTNGYRWVTFANDESEPVITITNFDDFILEYMKYLGEPIGNCQVCGKLIELTGNKKLYCGECWGDLRREQVRQNVNNYRNRNVIK